MLGATKPKFCLMDGQLWPETKACLHNSNIRLALPKTSQKFSPNHQLVWPFHPIICDPSPIIYFWKKSGPQIWSAYTKAWHFYSINRGMNTPSIPEDQASRPRSKTQIYLETSRVHVTWRYRPRETPFTNIWSSPTQIASVLKASAISSVAVACLDFSFFS